MTERLQVSLERVAAEADISAVQKGLRAFNVAMIGDPAEEPVHAFIRDASGAVVGGLLGVIKWRWLFVSKLWVSDAYRGQGYGVDLMKAAEARAVARNCLGIYLDTAEYQARPFYEKLGYELFGTLEGYPPGFSQYYLAKRLAPREP